MIDFLKLLSSLPYWSWLGMMLGSVIATSAFVFGYKDMQQRESKSNRSELILLKMTNQDQAIDLMLKNIGGDNALAHEFEFTPRKTHLTRGTCAYMPPSEYLISIDLRGKKYPLLPNASVRANLSQKIGSGDVDRIKINFSINKDPCLYVDIEGAIKIKYDNKELEVPNVILSF